METAPTPNLWPILTVFTATYAVALIVAGLIAAWLQLQSGTGLSVAALVASALVAGQKFTTAAQRKPTPRERNRLALYSLVISFALSFLFAMIAILAIEGIAGLHVVVSLFASLPLPAWIIIVVIAALLSFAVLLLGYGWMTSRLYAQRLRAGKN